MITEPGELRSAVIWRSLYQIALAELSEQEAGFTVLLEESKENYGNAMERLKVRLDTDLDGEPERPQNFGNYMRIMI
jgi:chromosome condensin MukBEF ATPase and DNA-binding subunit MukB